MIAAVDTESATTTTTGDLLEVIRWAEDNRPRSLQRTIGPSSVGTPCERRLALELLGAPRHNVTADKWAATVGTAVHAWLAEAFTADNNRRVQAGQPPRWLVEQPVTVRTGLSGSTDLYDLHTHTVIDWKVLGKTSLDDKRRADDPGQQYRWQAHLYGMGWARAGLPVRDVAIVALPKSGILRDTWRWRRPYDPQVAEQALARMDAVLTGMDVAESVGALDAFVGLLGRDTTNCRYCPFYTPNRELGASNGCAGPLENLAPGEEPPPVQALAGIF
jgi:hypothetical protein